MAMTPSERQAKRREKVKSERGQGFSAMFTEEEVQALDHLVRHYGMSKRDVIGKCVLEEHARVIQGMLDDKNALDRYMKRSE